MQTERQDFGVPASCASGSESPYRVVQSRFFESLLPSSWRLNDGSYVLANDASFEPWRDLQMDGKRLERRR